MDIAFDTTWCPTCSRQILPKRIQVPITPQPQAQPVCSPQPMTAEPQQPPPPTTRLGRTKTGTIRARNGGGLVHGTGRVKPNGTIKRTSPTKSDTSARKQTAAAPVPPPSPASPHPPAAPIRHKTIIDQSPVPLYCSDECRLADMQSLRGIDIHYHPERHGSPTVPVADPLEPQGESSDSGIGSSLESDASSVSSTHSPTEPSAPSQSSTSRTGPIPRGYAALASIYDLPPCPPPAPILPRTKVTAPTRTPAEEYTSGIMMAAQRIHAAIGPREKKRPSWATPASQLSTAYALQNAYGYTGVQQKREVVPGWTDGTDKWRASVYSFARPDEDVSASMVGENDERNSAYRGFVSTPCRSKGVYSTMGETKEGDVKPEKMSRVMSQPCARARSEAEELYAKWDMTFAKRSESRTSLSRSHQAALLSTSPGSTHSLPAYAPRREVPILKKGAEGKLLVPDVKLRRADSSMSFERMGLSRQGSEASVSGRAKYTRSGSTSGSSVAEEGEEALKISRKARSPPPAETWYEEDARTYDLLTIPRKERKMVTKVVDGLAVVEEVEIEVFPERKRLFLFPGRNEP